MLNDSHALDRTFQALADPIRRGLLASLSQGPASVSELARPLPISLPAVLQHLQSLEAGGLIRTEKVATKAITEVTATVVEALVKAKVQR